MFYNAPLNVVLTGIPLLEESPARQSIFSLRGHYWGVGRGGTRDQNILTLQFNENVKKAARCYTQSCKSIKKNEAKRGSERLHGKYPPEAREEFTLLALPALNIFGRTHMLTWHEEKVEEEEEEAEEEKEKTMLRYRTI